MHTCVSTTGHSTLDVLQLPSVAVPLLAVSLQWWAGCLGAGCEPTKEHCSPSPSLADSEVAIPVDPAIVLPMCLKWVPEGWPGAESWQPQWTL